MQRTAIAAIVGLAALTQPLFAEGGPITANCTGMVNLDIYEIARDEPKQDVDGIGTSEVTVNDAEILLKGAFGLYRFDLEAGTLYHNDSDTGVYCTFKGLDK